MCICASLHFPVRAHVCVLMIVCSCVLTQQMCSRSQLGRHFWRHQILNMKFCWVPVFKTSDFRSYSRPYILDHKKNMFGSWLRFCFFLQTTSSIKTLWCAEQKAQFIVCFGPEIPPDEDTSAFFEILILSLSNVRWRHSWYLNWWHVEWRPLS